MSRKLAIILGSLLVGWLGSVDAQKSKTSSNWPCRLEFRDVAGDAIRSDGKGAYVNGLDAVTCVVVPPDSGSLTAGDVSLYFANRPGRGLIYATQPGNGLHSGWEEFYDRGSLRVKLLADVPEGQVGYRAFISYSGVGRFVASDEGESDPVRDVVRVERVSTCTWDISFDPGIDPPSGAALMELWDGSGWTRYRGAFQLPTGMTVTVTGGLTGCPSSGA
jgi:hypothetical protein